jgi:gamma-glutamyltranspeptidase
VSLTYTLEYGYGSRIVVPGAGFLLNNEMGDFNAGPGLTNEQGLIGTAAQPGAARQAHALEHVADHRREGRPAVHGDRFARRPHHHQHRAA